MKKIPVNVEKFRNIENVDEFVNVKITSEILLIENPCKCWEFFERWTSSDSWESWACWGILENEEVENIEVLKKLMLKLLRLFRIHILLHSGYQGGPCKASFAEYISHQTLKLKNQKVWPELSTLWSYWHWSCCCD